MLNRADPDVKEGICSCTPFLLHLMRMSSTQFRFNDPIFLFLHFLSFPGCKANSSLAMLNTISCKQREMSALDDEECESVQT